MNFLSVILTLSSDEEEDDIKGSVSGTQSSSGASNSPPASGPLEPISHKEPIITADMEDVDGAEETDPCGEVIGKLMAAGS